MEEYIKHVSPPAQQNSPCYVPSDSVSHSVTVNMIMLTLFALGDDDGFFLICSDLEGRSFIPHLYFSFLKWKSAHAHQFHFLQVQSTVAQQAETTGRMFPDK